MRTFFLAFKVFVAAQGSVFAQSQPGPEPVKFFVHDLGKLSLAVKDGWISFKKTNEGTYRMKMVMVEKNGKEQQIHIDFLAGQTLAMCGMRRFGPTIGKNAAFVMKDVDGDLVGFVNMGEGVASIPGYSPKLFNWTFGHYYYIPFMNGLPDLC